MRVQQLIKAKMRAGSKQEQLSRLWSDAMVLVIGQVSIVAAACYNMLDFRAVLGRSKDLDVCESNYRIG